MLFKCFSEDRVFNKIEDFFIVIFFNCVYYYKSRLIIMSSEVIVYLWIRIFTKK